MLQRRRPSPARIREQRVLAPLRHIAVVAVVHGLRGVVGGQVVGWGVLGGAGAAPLAQWLLGAIRAVDVVADDPRLACHVEDPGVVLGPGEVLGGDLVRSRLRGVVVGDSGHVGDSGLEAS